MMVTNHFSTFKVRMEDFIWQLVKGCYQRRQWMRKNRMYSGRMKSREIVQVWIHTLKETTQQLPLQILDKVSFQVMNLEHSLKQLVWRVHWIREKLRGAQVQCLLLKINRSICSLPEDLSYKTLTESFQLVSLFKMKEDRRSQSKVSSRYSHQFNRRVQNLMLLEEGHSPQSWRLCKTVLVCLRATNLDFIQERILKIQFRQITVEVLLNPTPHIFLVMQTKISPQSIKNKWSSK